MPRTLPDELTHALALALAAQAKDRPIAAGSYPFGHDISLRIVGSLVKDADHEGKPGNEPLNLPRAVAWLITFFAPPGEEVEEMLAEALARANWKTNSAVQALEDKILAAIKTAEKNTPATPAKVKAGARHASIEIELKSMRKVKAPC